MNVSYAIGLFVKLFLLLTPFFILSVFVTTCTSLSPAAQRRLAIRTTIAVIAATVIIYLFGEVIFRYLGITLDAFRIGAGLVLLLNGIDMVRTPAMPKNRDVGEADPSSDPSVVPLAIPTTVGPGTIGTLLVMGAESHDFSRKMLEISAIIVAGAMVGVLLYFADYLEKVLKSKGLSILTKLTGMFIVALAAQVIFSGVSGMLSGTLQEIFQGMAGR